MKGTAVVVCSSYSTVHLILLLVFYILFYKENIFKKCDILELLSDGYNSDIGSIDNEDDFFPDDELQNLSCELENEDTVYDLPDISDDNNTIFE